MIITHVLDIPKGCARLTFGKNSNGKYMFVIGASENQIDLDTINPGEFYKTMDVKENVLGIILEDYRQAEGYAAAFDKLARQMKEDQNGNEI